jgi:hypothetical protein
VEGREAIKAMFEQEFLQAKMVCMVENLFKDSEWAILEWKDPLGLRGCGFFRVQEDKIIFQRGYKEQAVSQNKIERLWEGLQENGVLQIKSSDPFEI